MANQKSTRSLEEMHIPQYTTFNGDIETEHNARIDGVVRGNVSSQGGNVLIGMDAVVEGDITGNDIAIGGQIKGDIIATGQVSIFSGAKLVGNVRAASFVVEFDTVYEGHLMINCTETDDIKEKSKKVEVADNAEDEEPPRKAPRRR